VRVKIRGWGFVEKRFLKKSLPHPLNEFKQVFNSSRYIISIQNNNVASKTKGCNEALPDKYKLSNIPLITIDTYIEHQYRN
jgi:hypothetical protein